MAIAAFWGPAWSINPTRDRDKSEDSVQLEYGEARKAIRCLMECLDFLSASANLCDAWKNETIKMVQVLKN